MLGGTLFMSATDEELRHADALGIDHVSYALFDFSLSFIIYLVITFLVHLYSNSGRNATKDNTEPETGYAKLNQNGHDVEGAEQFELTEQDGSLSGDEDAIKIHTEDEVEWMEREGRARGVRL